MQDMTVGRVIRLLRIRKRWRQQDLADRACVSQGLISLLERGRLDRVSLRAIRVVLAELDARAWLDVRWDHGLLDRLLDEGHASLAGAVAARLARWDWVVAPEVSYSVFGERGSIDLLAWQATTRTLLVVEIKTELVSIEATLRKHDEKVRLAPAIAVERFGWRAAAVGGVVVLPPDRTERRRVDRHAAVLMRALPVRGHDLRRWLQRPAGPVAGLWFVTPTNGGAAKRRGDSGSHARMTLTGEA
jgi:transcriptional regulator with XRE-family HTH domain